MSLLLMILLTTGRQSLIFAKEALGMQIPWRPKRERHVLDMASFSAKTKTGCLGRYLDTRPGERPEEVRTMMALALMSIAAMTKERREREGGRRKAVMILVE